LKGDRHLSDTTLGIKANPSAIIIISITMGGYITLRSVAARLKRIISI